MSKTALISVVLATYNGGSQLDSCLSRLMKVADRNIEVIIADDGSSSDRTFEIIERHMYSGSARVMHAWQEDVGFRLARSRNNAVGMATGDFLLFLDHDILLPNNFFRYLRSCMLHGWFVGGRRIKLDISTTRAVLEGRMQIPRLFAPTFLWHAYLRKLIGRRFLLPLRDRSPGKKPQPFRGMSGFCIGVWRGDFEAVDGFDARYQGYGVEDWDFMARLNNLGIHGGYLPYQATMAHLWHQETPHDIEGIGYQMLRDVEDKKIILAGDGYSLSQTNI